MTETPDQYGAAPHGGLDRCIGGLVAASIVLILALTFVDALAPPRSGDAMRYHLAQPKEMLRSGILHFLPYFHYNFPRTFHLAFLPGEWIGWPSLSAVVCWAAMLAACAAVVATTREMLHEAGTTLPDAWIVVLVLACFYLTPGIVQAASVPNSDVAVLCFFAWGMRLCLRLADERGGGWNALAAGLCLGLAVGSKYHGLLLVFLFLTVWFLLADGRRFLHFPGRVAALLGTIVAVGSPFYVLNWIHTGNPVWPLFADQLGDGGLLNRVASGYRMPPRFDLTLLTDQLRQPFNANPLVLCLVPLSWPLLPRSRRLRVLAVTAIAYLVSLVLLTSYHRFHLMAWPPLTVLALAGAAASRGTVWRRRLAMTFLVGSVAIGTSFAGWYSWDFLRWAAGLTRSEEIRELSFYYPDYRWMNQSLRASTDVVMVCVRSGHTYYLDVPHVRADPGLAATVDWSDVHAEGPTVLQEFLQKRGVTHIFIDEQLDLRVTEAMERLRQLGSVELLWSRGRMLLTQRMLRRTLSTTVALYRVLPEGSPGSGTHQR